MEYSSRTPSADLTRAERLQRMSDEWWLYGSYETRCSVDLWKEQLAGMGKKPSLWTGFSDIYSGYYSDYDFSCLMDTDLGENAAIIDAVAKALEGETFKTTDETFCLGALNFSKDVLPGTRVPILMSSVYPPTGPFHSYRSGIWGLFHEGRAYHFDALPELFETLVTKRNERHMSLVLRERLYRLGEDEAEAVDTAARLSGEIHELHCIATAAGLLHGLSVPDVNFRILKEMERRTRVAERLESECGPRCHEYAICELSGGIEIRFLPRFFHSNLYQVTAEERARLKARQEEVDGYNERLRQHVLTGSFEGNVQFSIEPFQVIHKWESNQYRGVVVKCDSVDAKAMYCRLQEFPRF